MRITFRLPESHGPRCRARVGTCQSRYMITIRLPWRPRARPSATLHEIPICSMKSKLGIKCYRATPSSVKDDFRNYALSGDFTAQTPGGREQRSSLRIVRRAQPAGRLPFPDHHRCVRADTLGAHRIGPLGTVPGRTHGGRRPAERASLTSLFSLWDVSKVAWMPICIMSPASECGGSQ